MTEPTALQPSAAGRVERPRPPKVRPPRFTPDPQGRYCDCITRAPDKHLCDLSPGAGTKDHKRTGPCKYHGGDTPSGPASPHWKHGKNSKHTRIVRDVLSPRARARLFAGRDDPDLLELLDDIALFRKRRDQLLAKLGSRESGATWRELTYAFRALRRAIAENNTEKMATALTALDSAIHSGASEYAQWTEIVSIVNNRVRIVESERQHAVEQQQVLTAKQAETLMAMLEAAVRKHVSDPATLDAIGQDLARTVGVGFGAAVPLLQ